MFWIQCLVLVGCFGVKVFADQDVGDLFDNYFEWKLSLNPLRASSHGNRLYDSELPSRAQSQIRGVKNKCRFFLRRSRRLLRRGGVSQR